MLKKYSDCIGVSGYESKIVNILFDTISKYDVDDIYIDNVGNLICLKKGSKSNKKIMISAHVDEVGIQIIKEIDNEEYRFKCLGNVKTWNLCQSRMKSYNSYGVVYTINEGEFSAYNYENLVFKNLSSNKIKIGEVFTFADKLIESEDFYCGKALDNRISVYILSEILKNGIKPVEDIYFVFTVQEEIGMRGIRVAKTNICPNVCLTVDVTNIGKMNSVEIQKGVCIKVSDSLGVSNYELVKKIEKISNEGNIVYQYEVSDNGTTEMIITNEKDNGCKEIGISIPCKYIHTSNTIVSKFDVHECEKLLSLLISNEL